MTHLTYIMAAYALAVLVGAVFSVDAWARMGRARRRLAAIDPRATPLMTRKRRRLVLLLACGLGLGTAAALVLTAFSDNMVFFLAPADLASQGAA